MSFSHEPPTAAKSPSIPRPRLDWNNKVAVRTWCAAMATALADYFATTEDMLRPPRERELGHVTHRAHHDEAVLAIDQLMSFATPLDED